ncbi:MAG: hypothetical protein JNK70_13885 [Phycisphaerae bacterium]|nr:hypothetical protein [Phycisphaerae bacterium]
MRLTTTLNRIRDCGPCTTGWRKLLDYLGKDFDPDAEINLLTLLDSNNVPDLLWTLRATVQDSRKVASRLAIEFAEQVLPIFEQRYPDDLRPRQAIQAARDYLDGKISVEELRAAAYADAAYAAAAYAAYAAYAAADAADAAAAARKKQAEIIRSILE